MELESMNLLREFKKHTFWQKIHKISGQNQSIWRLDDFGNWIRYTVYGNIQSTFDWEFDHIFPD